MHDTRIDFDSTTSGGLAANVLDALPDPVIVLDADFRYAYVNRAAEAVTGIKREELIGRSHGAFHSAEKSQALQAKYREAKRTGKAAEFDEYCEPVDRWFDVTATPGRDGTLVVAFRDATEKTLLSDQLASGAARLVAAFDEAAVGLALTASDGTFLHANAAYERITGYTRDELRSRTWQSITHPDDLAVSTQMKSDLFRGRRRTAVFEKRYLRKDGSAVWVRNNVSVNNAPGVVPFSIVLSEDVTARRTSEDRLLRSESLFRALIENAMDMITLLDREGRVLYRSPAAERLLGYAAAEVLGRPVWDLIHPDDLPGVHREFFESLSAYGRTAIVEHRVRHRDGRWRTFEAIATNLLHDPAVSAVVVNSRDVTDRVEAQRLLREALNEARAATAAKSRFLANMSHEIRTPMNAVLGTAELLADHELTAEQRDQVETIRFSAQALLGLINDILDMSKIEAGKLRVQPGPTELRALFKHVQDLFRPQLMAKGLTFRWHFPECLPAAIQADESRLRQVLTNLIGNAVKFTERGGVEVTAECESGRLRVVVADTGIGIPEALRPTIFSSFVQADDSAARRFGGTGLGLAISKELVQLMGGQIGFDSVAGEGSSFWFEIPAPACCAVGAVTGAPDGVGAAVAGARVLLAEDNDVNRRIASTMLTRAGYLVDEACDGREAVAALSTAEYDLVLMDLQMPGMDGYQATQALRKLDRAIRVVPVVAITANAMAGDRDRCMDAGMDDYLAKPYRREEMLAKVADWVVRGRERIQNLGGANRTPPKIR